MTLSTTCDSTCYASPWNAWERPSQHDRLDSQHVLRSAALEMESLSSLRALTITGIGNYRQKPLNTDGGRTADNDLRMVSASVLSDVTALV